MIWSLAETFVSFISFICIDALVRVSLTFFDTELQTLTKMMVKAVIITIRTKFITNDIIPNVPTTGHLSSSNLSDSLDSLPNKLWPTDRLAIVRISCFWIQSFEFMEPLVVYFFHSFISQCFVFSVRSALSHPWLQSQSVLLFHNASVVRNPRYSSSERFDCHSKSSID